MNKAIDDSRGVAVSAPDDGALNAFESALISLVSFRRDPLAIINEVIRQCPDFALAHIFKALTLTGLTERRFALAARKSLDAAAPLLADTGTREQQLFSAAQAQLDGFSDRASGIFEELVVQNPRDLLSLHLGHSTDFTHGDAANLRNRVARVLPLWDSTLPGYAFVLAMHAFGLEECNEYLRAEEAGRKSLELEARNPWAVHAVAHVMEMCGRIDEGIEHLESRCEDWSVDSGFACHIWWHLALFHLDCDNGQRVFELYDKHIDTEDASFALSKIDATALLWRLALFDVDVGDRWLDIASFWRNAIDREAGHDAFNDFHAALAFAAIRDDEALETLLARMRDPAEADSNSNRAQVRQSAGIPLVEALAAYSQLRYADAAAMLAQTREASRAAGGSHAQRDIITLTLIHAASRAGESRLVNHFLNERLVSKPASPLGWRLQERYAV